MTDVYLLGEVRVRPLTDATGEFFQPVRDAFPDASEDAWRRAAARDPDAFAGDGRWRLRFRCYLVTVGPRTILVDAGVGPADAPAAAWAPVPGHLPDQLAAAGVEPDDIDTVVLTHLHGDHVGWAVAPTLFANARHVLQQAEHDVLDELNPALRHRLLDPLRATGQLHLIDGAASLAPGVRTRHAPGHTPGHQVVLVDGTDETLAISADAFVHAVQFADPGVAYAFESQPEQAHATRLALLDQADVFATAHLSEPFLNVGENHQ